MKQSILVMTLIFSTCAVTSCTKKQRPVSELTAIETGEVSQQINFIGRIRAEKTTLVRAPIEGLLVKMNKSLGSSVEVGEIVATIEQPKDESRVTGVIQDKGHLEQIRLRRSQAEVRLQNAQKEIARLDRLLKSGSIASTELEAAQVASQMIGKEIESFKAEEKNLIETVSAKKVINRDSTRNLVATGPGVITQLWTTEDNITPGMTIPKDTIVATIEEAGQYVLKGEVVEADYIRMKIGQPVEINLIHGVAETVKGAVKSISPVARQDQFGVGRFDVTASFAAGKSALKSGLEARGKITLQKKASALRLPRAAVRQVGAEFRVSFPGKDQTLFKAVRVGLIGDQYLEITGGLEPSEKVYQSYVEPNP